MFKNGLIAGAVFALSVSAAFANGGSFVPPPDHHGAAYIGGGISGDDANFRITTFNNSVYKALVTPFPTVATSTRGSFLNWNALGIDGEIFGGYGAVIRDHYSLALELFGQISSDRGKIDLARSDAIEGTPFFQSNASANIRRQWTAGAAFMPGVMLAPTTNLYFRLAYIYSRFQFHDVGTTNRTPFGPVGLFDGFPDNLTRNRGGMQLGVGMSTLLCPRLALRGEFRWERYGTLGFNNTIARLIVTSPPGAIPVTAVGQLGYGTIRIRPTVKSINIGISYLFHVA